YTLYSFRTRRSSDLDERVGRGHHYRQHERQVRQAEGIGHRQRDRQHDDGGGVVGDDLGEQRHADIGDDQQQYGIVAGDGENAAAEPGGGAGFLQRGTQGKARG